MTAASIKAGDVVQCDVRGHRFYAVVSEKLSANHYDDRNLRGPIVIMPITAGVTYRAVKPREVVELYRKARRRQAAPVSVGQLGRWRDDA